MKILFYIHDITGGGAERVLSMIANEFSRRNEEVFIATKVNSNFAYHINKNINLCNLYRNIPCDNNIINRIKSPIILRKNIRDIAKKVSPDIIIAFTSAMGCSVIFSTLGLGIPIVVSEHTNVSRHLGLILNIKRNILYPFANAVTILTRHDMNIWRNKFNNLVYMPNPIEIDKEKHENSDRKKIVLAAGRVDRWHVKGFDNLIRCWSKLWECFPEWKLQIAGNYNEKSISELSMLANELNCSNLEFLGFRKDVNKLMTNSEIFCLSSRVEGLPMVLIEAMNAGCCCVSFDVVTGPREIITNYKSGLIAKNQNNDDLTEKLRLVMSDEDLRHRLARNASTSINKYSIERIINRWYILFNKISNRL